MACGKTSVRKKSCQAPASMQKPDCAGKNSSWFVTCSTYMMVCINHKCKCLWRGRLMSLYGSFVTFTSHYFYILSKVMMTSIRMKPWLSNRMKFVIVHGSLSYRLFLRDNNLYSLYSAFTNHVTITLWEGVVRSGLVLPVVSLFAVSVCKRGAIELQFPSL